MRSFSRIDRESFPIRPDPGCRHTRFAQRSRVARRMPLAIRMSQPPICRVAPIACVLIGASACMASMKPPVVNSGPVLSKDGVQIAVVRQAC